MGIRQRFGFPTRPIGEIPGYRIADRIPEAHNRCAIMGELDGTLLFLPAGWWNDNSELIEYFYALLHTYRPDEEQEIIESGNAYMAADAITQMVQIVANAVGRVGAQNFDSQALYEAATSYTETRGGIMRATFSETKRASLDYMGVYEADGSAQDLFRIQEDWIAVLHGP